MIAPTPNPMPRKRTQRQAICPAQFDAPAPARVIALRAAAGLTPEQLAQHLGCSLRMIHMVERGQRRLINGIRLARLAKLAGVTVEQLLTPEVTHG